MGVWLIHTAKRYKITSVRCMPKWWHHSRQLVSAVLAILPERAGGKWRRLLPLIFFQSFRRCGAIWEKGGVQQEHKRIRSTSTTPRSDSARAREPFEYDQITEIGPIGPSSDEGDEPGLTDSTTGDPCCLRISGSNGIDQWRRQWNTEAS